MEIVKNYKYYFAYLNNEFVGCAKVHKDWMEVHKLDGTINEFNFRVVGIKKGFTLKYSGKYRSVRKVKK